MTEEKEKRKPQLVAGVAAEEFPGWGLDPLFSNRVNVSAGSHFIRLAFGETLGGEESAYHTLVVMPANDALNVANLIIRLHAQALEVEEKVAGKSDGNK